MSLPLPLYILLFAFFVYLFVRILSYTVTDPGSPILAGMYFIEFGIHEASHMVAMFLPNIAVAMAGSIGEIAFTVLLLIACIKYRNYFAAVFASLWLMLALRSVGLYIQDARSQLIPLVGPSEVVKHDWNFILSELGALSHDATIGAVLIITGIVIGALALAGGLALMVLKVMKSRKLAS